MPQRGCLSFVDGPGACGCVHQFYHKSCGTLTSVMSVVNRGPVYARAV
jgi:hypothetical protein